MTSGAGDAERRHERSAARLGHQRRDTYYLHRHGGRPASLSGHGARLPVHHRHRDARADDGARGPRCPITLVACIGGGSNAIELFYPFLDDRGRQDLRRRSRRPGLDVEERPRCVHERRRSGRAARQPHISPAGCGRTDPRGPFASRPASTIRASAPSIRGSRTPAASEYVSITDKETLDAFQLCARLEGIIPALESSHALGWVTKLAPTLPENNLLVVRYRARRQGRLGRRWLPGNAYLIMTKESRIDRRFAALKKDGRKALVCFVTAGDPDLETSKQILLGLPKAGCDVIELGMPFSDPMADGPAIQASAAARAQGWPQHAQNPRARGRIS